jgi:hypothetical protein
LGQPERLVAQGQYLLGKGGIQIHAFPTASVAIGNQPVVDRVVVSSQYQELGANLHPVGSPDTAGPRAEATLELDRHH